MRIIAVAVMVLLVGCSGKREADLAKCDSAIMAKLKAPATYKRISASGDPQFDKPKYTITYDAANSFGVPLRADGLCYLSNDRSDVQGFP